MVVNSLKFRKKFTSSSRNWLIRQRNDPYVKQAEKDGYRSRAAYKLIEMDDRFQFIRNSKKIIDVGAAPGGWSQVLSKKSSSNTKIAAIDLLQFAPVCDKIRHFVGNFEDENVRKGILDFLEGSADLIVSDMAPATIGHRQSDHWRMMALVESAYMFSQEILQKGGAFVAKIFRGGDEKIFFEKMRNDFELAEFFKPKSSRQESVEMYVIGLGYKYSTR